MAGILLLLGLAMASALIVQHVRVPYTVVLVVIGLIAGTAGVRPGLDLNRDLILHVFLPLLLFEAALQVNLDALRDTRLPIALLAIPGVVISTLVVGAILHLATELPFASATLFGALVSATDPVSVLATFKRLQVPEKLATLIEGESVLNDGTALVLFSLLLPAAQGQSFSVPLAVLEFFGVLAVGAAIGCLAGWLGARAVRLFDDHLAELTLSAVVAYGSFLLAERLHGSGVIATVVAGLVFATRASPGMTVEARGLIAEVWEFAAFIANSMLFILIGVKVGVRDLGGVVADLSWAIAAMLVGRALIVYGFGAALRWMGHPFLWANGHVVFWSGLRGGLAIALALSLPAEFAGRGLFLQLTSGVVLFTLLVQGITVDPLLRWTRSRAVP